MIEERGRGNKQCQDDRQSRALSNFRRAFRVIVLGWFCVIVFPAFDQSRDHLTDPESERVREYQQLDKRIEVFIKAIDRRFAIINGTPQPEQKKKDKEKEDWGELPKGTRAQLLDDIAGILDEAISNIDDVSRRDEKNPLISRSMRALTTASNRYLAQLATLKNQTKDPDELSAINRIADNANQIVEVGSKLPAASEEEKKRKKP